MLIEVIQQISCGIGQNCYKNIKFVACVVWRRS